MDPFAHAAPPTVSFTDLGIREPIAEALRTAFPNIQTPTDVQTAFIPAILGGKDVLLKDATGTGKSVKLACMRLSCNIDDLCQVIWCYARCS
jgi:superfamily II DNA/RNA helicase